MSEQSINVFGDLVRGVREGAGISLRTVAAELGFSVAYVSDVERGLRGPFRRVIVTRLANVLGTDELKLQRAADLSRREFVLPSDTRKHNETACVLAAKWTQLQPEQLDAILALVEDSHADRPTRLDGSELGTSWNGSPLMG